MSLLAAAIAAGSAEPPPGPTPPRHFLNGTEQRGCEEAARKDEVLVCGREDAQERYRLRADADDRFAQQPLRAEAKVFGNTTMKAHAKQANVGGISAPRAMVTLSWPF
ncbi:hypothetical protein [uncultured Sphingomonas sp.]|uniref:hypothetical protein n=1 Tax=uncultured Sphingomonas sp. TaxID=158754 RepID=UPI0025E1AA95|nr:hypothetical protein [uncultured Sphingomonas sp.]